MRMSPSPSPVPTGSLNIQSPRKIETQFQIHHDVIQPPKVCYINN